MAKPQDIGRLKEGKEAWNSWAKQLLQDKRLLQDNRIWSVDAKGAGTNQETRDWIENATVDFTGHIFKSHAILSEFIFPHTTVFNNISTGRRSLLKFSNAEFHSDAQFRGINFGHVVDFSGAKFLGEVNFGGSIFEHISNFNSTRFRKAARFRRVEFKSDAWFPGAKFFNDAVFSEATFGGSANFSETEFVGLASFDWVESRGPFSLSEAKFNTVPDFTQTSFRAPVRLDYLEVVVAEPFQSGGNKERAARYRGLKKIAIESHDHLRELQFFADEAKERRANDDPKWGSAWLFSFFYEFVADFGRSIVRPFLLWLGSTAIFWFTYFELRIVEPHPVCKIGPVWEALYLSLKSAFLVIGWERSQKLNHVYSCLYGGSVVEPDLPAAIPFLQMGQTLWSAILIFLFFLALRNHFRIK